MWLQVLIFTVLADAEGYLIAAAVGSDVLGIAIVLVAAMSLLRLRPRFSATMCNNNENSMSGPAVVSRTDRV